MIRLSKNAPWATREEIVSNPDLRRTYREWFAQVGERHFKATADGLYAPWWVEEVDRHGRSIFSVEEGFKWGRWAFRLSEVRALIEEETSG